MKHILVPTDFSPQSEYALQVAAQLAKKFNADIYLLHVLELPLHLATVDSGQIPEAVFFMKLAQQKFEKFKAKPYLKDIIVHEAVESYKISDGIKDFSKENKIDLIVMGTKGRSDTKKLAIGTNAGHVITKVKCVTMVIPENATYKTPKEIAFPTDFSIFYRPGILQPIMDIVEDHGSSVHVLHANRNGWELNEDQKKNKEFLDDYLNNISHSFNFSTNKNLEDALQQFVDDQNIHVISMMAKNLNYFQKILFHPSSKDINYYKKVPFLVLH